MTSLRTLALLLIAGCAAGPTSGAGGRSVDLLVFAPHPDDETLGCAGILRQTLAAGGRVKIVLVTNGDGFPGFASLLARKPADQLGPEDFLELARYRQNQSLEALRILGGRSEDLVFLGYPDSGLEPMTRTQGPTRFQQKFTRKSETYGMAARDYRSAVDGRPSPYTSAAALADVVDLIRASSPARILVTGPADRHPDHRATFRLVSDGALAAGYAGPIDTYLIHGGPEWPWPLGITPEARFDAHLVKGEQVPLGVPWPPPRRIALSAQERRAKLDAIGAHATHLAGALEGSLAQERAYLESFVKSEEVFWPAERR
jgi:LmbE family N-acetylglucosaminyl deacetylase